MGPCHQFAVGIFNSRARIFTSTVFLSVWFGLLIFGRSTLFQDPGTFWHTAAGQRILDRCQVMVHDEWTYTFHGQKWIANQWLAECTMAGLHRIGGWDAQLLATATILAAFYAWLLSRVFRTGLNWAATGLLLMLVLGASSHHFHVRPHLMTIVLMGVSFAWMSDVESGRRNAGALVWLVPLVAVWTNLHGGALGGLFTIWFVLIGWIVLRLWRHAMRRIDRGGCDGSNPQRAMLGTLIGSGIEFDAAQGQPASESRMLRQAGLLTALAVACGMAILINPLGTEIPKSWLAVMRLSLPDVIQEHQRLDPSDPLASIVLGIGLAYLTALAGVPWRQWRITWLAPLLWLALSCDRVRHVPLFAVVATLGIAEILPLCSWKDWLKSHAWLTAPQADTAVAARSISSFRRRLSFAAVPCGLICLGLGLQQAKVQTPLLGANWVQLDPAIWPVELLPDLAELTREAGPTPRVFNALHFGGFITFHAPVWRTFIDDRCELFGDEFLRRYAHAEAANPAQIDAWHDQFAFHAALVKTNSPFDCYLAQHRGWTVVRRTAAATLYKPVANIARRPLIPVRAAT